jgi:chromosome segregation ATPase
VDQYRKTLSDLRGLISQNERQAEQQLQRLGGHIADLDPSKFMKTPLEEFQSKSLKYNTELRNTRELLEKANRTLGRVSEIEQALKQIKTDIARGERETTRRFEGVGQASYRAFSENPRANQSHRELFSDVSEYEESLKKLEKELTQEEAAPSKESFFTTAVRRSRAVLIRGRVRARKLRGPKLYQILGEKVLESDFVDAADNEGLTRIVEPVMKSKKSIEKSKTRGKALEKEKLGLLDQLRAIDDAQEPNRIVRRLAQNVKQAETALEDSLLVLGKLYLESPPQEDIRNEKIEECVNKLTALRKEKQKWEENAGRVEAALQIQQIDHGVIEMGSRITALTKEVQRRNREITSLKEKVASLEEERKRYVKVRGSEKDLIRGEKK